MFFSLLQGSPGDARPLVPDQPVRPVQPVQPVQPVPAPVTVDPTPESQPTLDLLMSPPWNLRAIKIGLWFVWELFDMLCFMILATAYEARACSSACSAVLACFFPRRMVWGLSQSKSSGWVPDSLREAWPEGWRQVPEKVPHQVQEQVFRKLKQWFWEVMERFWRNARSRFQRGFGMRQDKVVGRFRKVLGKVPYVKKPEWNCLQYTALAIGVFFCCFCCAKCPSYE